MKVFFNFSFSIGLLIEQTCRGTVITATETSRLCSMVEIYPTKEKSVKFKIENENPTADGKTKLVGEYKHTWNREYGICYLPNFKQGREGSIMLNDNNQLVTQIESEKEWIPVQDDTCVMRLYFYGCNNTRIVIKRL